MNDVVKKRFQFTTRDLLLGTAIVAFGFAVHVRLRDPLVLFMTIGSGFSVMFGRGSFVRRIVVGAFVGVAIAFICLVVAGGVLYVYEVLTA